MQENDKAGSAGIKVAVVGCGIWGRNHVRNYAELGALAALVDPDAGAAQALAVQHGVPAVTFEAALADPAIDAMVFAMPPSQNHAMGLRALEAGKHLFVEKPLALDLASAEDLCRAAERLGRVLMVGHILHYHAAFRALLAMVRSGRLGALRSIVASRLDLGRVRREEDVFWALAPHDISMVLALMGAEPATVEASAGYHLHPTIADVAGADLGFVAGGRAQIHVSWLHPFKEQRLTVVGTDAMAVFDDREPWERKLVLYAHRFDETTGVPVAIRAEPEPVAMEPGEPLREECRHFLHCVATGSTPLTDGWEALRVLRVLERASRAMAAGQEARKERPAAG